MVLVNLCVKNPSSLVKYHFTNPIIIEREDVNFHIPTLEEVKKLPKQKLKEYKKIAKAFLATVTTFLILPLRSMAQSSIPVGTTTLPNSVTGMPPELLELFKTILEISVGAAFFLAAILMVVNAMGRMFRLNGMTQWAKDIIRGLIQVMVAVPIVFLIYYVANLLFSGNGWFVSPF
jgi:hypothetical protein